MCVNFPFLSSPYQFMHNRGWNDEATETLNRRKRESGLSNRDDIRTMFDYIDADEGRSV